PGPADGPFIEVGPEALAEAEAALAAGPEGSVLWLGAPNNPTGLLPAGYPASVVELAGRHPDSLCICDEAFIDFCDGVDPAGAAREAAAMPNLVVLRSMTKFWAVPGLRAGYAVCSRELAAAIRSELPNWPLGSVAEAFARRAFADPAVDERRSLTRAIVAAERSRVAAAIAEFPGLTPLRSSANYYLVRVDAGLAGLSAPELASRLATMGVGVRRCGNYDGLSDDYLRLAVRSPGENDAITAAFAAALRGGVASPSPGTDSEPRPAARPGPRPTARRAKALMIQGCSSGAGKSLVAAAFCRIFRDEGYDVAPYKAQNMSLNSAVTPDGLELGRAQAVQASACGLEPDARMNPILLKPESDSGSQVVLLGRPYARRSARDYYAMHDELRAVARRAYDELAAERELMVLEGAGSPAEINLKSRDLVNMSAARHAGARVLLVGDIDRGGVFASFIGHVATFAPDELRMLSGFVVNKFRGDPALLGDAFAMTRDRTGYPVLGCVPMLRDLAIPDEDEPVVKAGRRPGAALRVAVPRLPR
ncbi:MAG TPA: cobyric acid synthase, partial [Spirochaetales bacterium]|nr:cobyric acid synthase [Spirochaetales bacterium]